MSFFSKHHNSHKSIHGNLIFRGISSVDSRLKDDEQQTPQSEKSIQKTPEQIRESLIASAKDIDQDKEEEAIRRAGEAPQIEQIRSRLNPPKETEAPKSPEQQTPTEIYQRLLKPKMDSVINAWEFRPVIEKCRDLLSQTTDENRVKKEKEIVHLLLKEFKKIPVNTWAFFPEAMAQEKAANCSGSAMVLGHILNEELKIKAEQANPLYHAVNLVTYSDGSTQYVDPRNNKTHEIKLEECIEEKDGFKIYKINKRGLEYSLLPVSNAEHAAGLTFMTNIVALKNSTTKDKKAAAIMASHGNNLDPNFAEKYSNIHYTTNPDTDQKWIAERRNISRRKYTTKIPLLGRFL